MDKSLDKSNTIWHEDKNTTKFIYNFSILREGKGKQRIEKNYSDYKRIGKKYRDSNTNKQ